MGGKQLCNVCILCLSPCSCASRCGCILCVCMNECKFVYNIILGTIKVKTALIQLEHIVNIAEFCPIIIVGG